MSDPFAQTNLKDFIADESRRLSSTTDTLSIAAAILVAGIMTDFIERLNAVAALHALTSAATNESQSSNAPSFIYAHEFLIASAYLSGKMTAERLAVPFDFPELDMFVSSFKDRHAKESGHAR